MTTITAPSEAGLRSQARRFLAERLPDDLAGDVIEVVLKRNLVTPSFAVEIVRGVLSTRGAKQLRLVGLDDDLRADVVAAAEDLGVSDRLDLPS